MLLFEDDLSHVLKESGWSLLHTQNVGNDQSQVQNVAVERKQGVAVELHSCARAGDAVNEEDGETIEDINLCSFVELHSRRSCGKIERQEIGKTIWTKCFENNFIIKIE